MTTNNDAKQLLDDITKTNLEAEEFIKKLDQDLYELDLKYAKSVVKNNIKTLKLAKSILQKKA